VKDSTPPAAPGALPRISGATVVVSNHDMLDVHVAPIQPVEISGRVVVDAADRAALQPSSITVGTIPADLEVARGGAAPVTVGDDLTFHFQTWPEPAYIVVVSPQWRMRAVHVNGADVTGKTVDFHAGAAVSDVEIDLAPAGAARP
jgi:hypothetical protein